MVVYHTKIIGIKNSDCLQGTYFHFPLPHISHKFLSQTSMILMDTMSTHSPLCQQSCGCEIECRNEQNFGTACTKYRSHRYINKYVVETARLHRLRHEHIRSCSGKLVRNMDQVIFCRVHFIVYFHCMKQTVLSKYSWMRIL